MNTQTYNHLLQFSHRLIKKYPNILIEKEDLVHDVWDFKEDDLSKVREQISKVFYRDYIKDVSKVYVAEIKKNVIKINQPDIQCKKCTDVKPASMFSFDKNSNTYASVCKRCKADAQNELNAKRRLSKTDKVLSVHKTLDQLISEKANALIENALQAANGNKTLACKMLKIDRRTFYNLYKPAPKQKITIQPLFEALNEAKNKIVKETLAEAKGNKTTAAKLLNIDRKTLYSYLK